MRKPVLIVIAGPNGSGKTSTTRLVINKILQQTKYHRPLSETVLQITHGKGDKEK